MASLIGMEIGKYRVTERLGQGGMAEVYAGVHTHLDRKVAIKVLHSYLLEGGDFLARFKREAKAVANLRHPNIVQVYDFDIQDQLIFMVMEYIDGVNLHAKLVEVSNRGERMPIKMIGSIINDIASALDYAHSKGMLHRDIKPSNIMIDSENKAYLTDFGIAKLLSDQKFTATGTLMGTPAYMSPEQGRGDDLSEESDIYSLGIIAFEMLTGQVPYDANTPIGIVHKQINDPIPDMSTLVGGVPNSAQEVIDRALAKAPESRFSSAEDLVSALRTALAALESTDPIAVPAEEPLTVIDDGLEAPTVTMEAEDMEKATVVMETETEEDKPVVREPKKEERKEKPVSKPKREKKKIPIWVFIIGGVALLAIAGVVLSQGIDFGQPVPTFTSMASSPATDDQKPEDELPEEERSGLEFFEQGEMHLGQGNPGLALEYFNRAIEAGYETGFLFHLRATALLNLGHIEESRDNWSQAIELEPNNFEFWLERGLRRYELGDVHGAVDDLLTAADKNPENYNVWHSLGEVYTYSGQEEYWDGAQTALERALEIEPTNPNTLRVSGDLQLHAFGNLELALEYFNKAVEYSGADDILALNARGVYFLETDQFEPCIEDYSILIENQPENPWFKLERGYCFRGLGDIDATRADFKRFLELAQANDEFDFSSQIDEVSEWLTTH